MIRVVVVDDHAVVREGLKRIISENPGMAATGEAGWPTPMTRLGGPQFDRQLAAELHRQMHILPADAAVEDVWSFLSLVLLPDVACWRFPDRSEERLRGHFRNVFRRLWWRAYILGATASFRNANARTASACRPRDGVATAPGEATSVKTKRSGPLDARRTPLRFRYGVTAIAVP